MVLKLATGALLASPRILQSDPSLALLSYLHWQNITSNLMLKCLIREVRDRPLMIWGRARRKSRIFFLMPPFPGNFFFFDSSSQRKKIF